VRLQDARTGWDRFDITLLRPQGWMAEHSRRVAGRSEVWVDFEELHAKGWAEVIEERPCPKIASGPGRVVTATITHANDDVRTLTMSSGETLHVTGNHRMYSATCQDWVPVKDLEIGEALRTVKGRESVAALGFQRGRHQVYNIEVETEHCYFVGDGEVLTHNVGSCVTDSAKPSSNETKYHGNDRRNADPQHNYDILNQDGNVRKNGVGTGLAENDVSKRAQSQLKKGDTYRITDRHEASSGARGRAYDREKKRSKEHYENGEKMDRHQRPKPARVRRSKK
jgi:hypothetical protein